MRLFRTANTGGNYINIDAIKKINVLDRTVTLIGEDRDYPWHLHKKRFEMLLEILKPDMFCDVYIPEDEIQEDEENE